MRRESPRDFVKQNACARRRKCRKYRACLRRIECRKCIRKPRKRRARYGIQRIARRMQKLKVVAQGGDHSGVFKNDSGRHCRGIHRKKRDRDCHRRRPFPPPRKILQPHRRAILTHSPRRKRFVCCNHFSLIVISEKLEFSQKAARRV